MVYVCWGCYPYLIVMCILDFQDTHDYEMRITAPTCICHHHDFSILCLDENNTFPRYWPLQGMSAISKPSPSLPTDALLYSASAAIIVRIDQTQDSKKERRFWKDVSTVISMLRNHSVSHDIKSGSPGDRSAQSSIPPCADKDVESPSE